MPPSLNLSKTADLNELHLIDPISTEKLDKLKKKNFNLSYSNKGLGKLINERLKRAEKDER